MDSQTPSHAKSVDSRNGDLRSPAGGAFRPRFNEITIRNSGRLPHWDVDGGLYFITFRLADSLPRSVFESIKRERECVISREERNGGTLAQADRRRIAKYFSDKVEAFLDSGAGSCVLARPDCAEIVANALHYFDGERYHLHAWCIMPNHVHVVVSLLPGRELSKVIKSWKGFTAREINKVLGREGRFWQRDYYDRLIRDDGEFERRVQYVIDNPAKAGLRDWQWVWMRGRET